MRGKNGAKKQRGASLVESMVAIPIIFVACLLTLQVMLLYRAKIALNFATQEAARVGSMSNGRVVPRFLTDVTAFWTVVKNGKASRVSVPPAAAAAADGNQPVGAAFNAPANGDQAGAVPALPASQGTSSSFMKSLGRGLLRYGDSSVLQGFINGITPLYTTGTGFLDVAKGQLNAYGDAMMNSCIIYHNPTQAAFLDFGFMEVDGPDKYVLQIPSDYMRYRIPSDVDSSGKHIGYYKKKGKYLSDTVAGIRGEISTMPVQDATLLSIEIKYSYPMQVPIAREIIIGLSRLYSVLSSDETAMGSAFVDFSLKHGRWPMSSFSTYRMQSPVAWNIFFPFGGSSAITTTDLEVFDLVQMAWNAVTEKMGNSFDPAEPQIGFCPGLLIDSMGINIGTEYSSDHWFGNTYDKAAKK